MPRGSLDDRAAGALRVTVRMGASRRRSVLRCVVSEPAPRRNIGSFSEGSCSPCQVPLLASGKRLGTKRLPSLLYIQITPYTALIPQRSWLEAWHVRGRVRLWYIICTESTSKGVMALEIRNISTTTKT